MEPKDEKQLPLFEMGGENIQLVQHSEARGEEQESNYSKYIIYVDEFINICHY